MQNVNHRQLQPPLFADGILLGLTICLVGFSLIMVYSTTGVVSQDKLGDAWFFTRKQALAIALGLAALYLCSRCPLSWLLKASLWALPLSLIFLGFTLIPGWGISSGGAQRWLSLGAMVLQPSEFVKVAFVLFMAGYFARQELSLGTWTGGVLKPALFLTIVCVLLLLQPDFGSCAILALVTFGMAWAAGVRLRHVMVSAAAALSLAGILILTSPYRMSRIISFLSPESDASGKGYQLTQSLIAVGSGRFTGVGLGDSQQKLFFLPAAHTDFIFAVISEEIGFLGAGAVILAFLVFLWRGLRIAELWERNTFAFTLAVGLTLLVVAPALLNIGVVIGLLPTKGLVLPLIGYGGSSMLASLLTVGILLALARALYREESG